ncbi:putative nwd2 protein [Mycena venus]|uniref:Putative nwd2 protein n=1 Tax=Mycena venus TaxID=2733690 RepID=A0A8H6YKB8_9AGAR|nr:putative nwd2 protein [Mycena venus]
MFERAVGFQIHGGSFYDVQSGDVNLHTNQYPTIQDPAPPDELPPASLTFEDRREREFSGVTRIPRQITGRPPYDVSSRRHPAAKNPSGEEHTVAFPSTSPHSGHPSAPKPLLRPQYPHYGHEPRGQTRLSTVPGLAHPPFHFYKPVLPFQGNTFIEARNVNYYHDHPENEKKKEEERIEKKQKEGMDILHRSAALHALYDSAESFPQPKCHPETRTRILDHIYNWAVDRHSACSIFWLYGPAGAGKSAIMQTLCRRLDEEHRLGGSFFFQRNHATRGNAKVLFVTLAYQLALRNPIWKGAISECAGDDPSVVGRAMKTQLHQLIVRACEFIQNLQPPILLIDGLDECESQEVQQELLRLIGNAASHHPRALRILIASRPEPHIREVFEKPSINQLHRILNINPSFSDIRIYLHDAFLRIHQEHHDTMRGVPTPWPSSDILDMLVEKSSGYFIYASTVIKFVDDKDFRPTERLAGVVNWQSLPVHSDRPFEALDRLYKQILCSVPARPRLLRILCALDNFPKLLSNDIEQLLELNPGDIGLSLRRLHSVFQVPSDGSRISVHHASFWDFLHDPSRSGEFCVSTLQRIELARSVLKTFACGDDGSTHQPHLNSKHIALTLSCSGIDYLTSSIPATHATELIPLIRSISPEWFWNQRDFDFLSVLKKMINWLQEIDSFSASEDLIQTWQNFEVLNMHDSRIHWYSQPGKMVPQPPNQCNEVFSQFPHLLTLLQAWWVCDHITYIVPSRRLFYIRRLLDIPWAEMHVLIRGPLQDLAQDTAKLRAVLAAAKAAEPRPTLYTDLLRGFLRLLKSIEAGNSGSGFIDMLWDRIFGSTPKSYEVLEDLRSLKLTCARLRGRWPADNGRLTKFTTELLLWLKSYPEPPLDVIGRWEHFLKDWTQKDNQGSISHTAV